MSTINTATSESQNEELGKKSEIISTEYENIEDVPLESIKPSASLTSSFFIDIDPSANLSICLLNCQQIYAKLDSFLKTKNASLKLKSLVIEKTNATVFRIEAEEDLNKLKHSTIWKSYAEKWLKEFSDSEIKFEQIKLDLGVPENLDLYTFLEAKIAEINRSFYGKSIFFELSADKRCLNGYGLLIPLYRNIEDLKFQMLNRPSADTSKLN
jgi:hypothetical protein